VRGAGMVGTAVVPDEGAVLACAAALRSGPFWLVSLFARHQLQRADV